jgi:hypothetical protein
MMIIGGLQRNHHRVFRGLHDVAWKLHKILNVNSLCLQSPRHVLEIGIHLADTGHHHPVALVVTQVIVLEQNCSPGGQPVSRVLPVFRTVEHIAHRSWNLSAYVIEGVFLPVGTVGSYPHVVQLERLSEPFVKFREPLWK